MKDKKETKISCEHCAKKIREKKKIIICSKCLDEIYDEFNFKSFRKIYAEKGQVFEGYFFGEDKVRIRRIKQLEEEEKKNNEKISAKFKTPREIKTKLDEYIIGQEKAKRILSVAAFNHLKRINKPENVIPKSNVFMIGPTGSGKTYLAEKLAKIIGVPMIIYDATTLTATGWKGNEVEDIIKTLLQKTDYNEKKSSQAIIFIDEIDKIAAFETDQRDINRAAVQQMLLKFIEETEIKWESYTVNTKNILFIVAGAFEKLEQFKKNENMIGFQKNYEAEKKENIIENLISFGMLREFIGRFSSIVSLDPLTKEILKGILKKPKNSMLSQYQNIFKIENIKLEILDEALDEIAEFSLKNRTGARSLKTYLDNLLLNIMYENLGNKKIEKILITKETLRTQHPEIEYRRKDAYHKCKKN